uniref:Uncharacterized protein n=1 Tax=Arundo donax TaxID=35708 RepID=A0A0A9A364_ARUDO
MTRFRRPCRPGPFLANKIQEPDDPILSRNQEPGGERTASKNSPVSSCNHESRPANPDAKTKTNPLSLFL